MIRTRLTITAGLLLAAVGIFGGWIIFKNFPATGEVSYTMQLGSDTRAVTRLGPDPRLRTGEGYQEVLEGPIYFDVRIMPWQQRAKIEIEYQEIDRTLNRIGGKVADPWQFDLRLPVETIDLSGGWKRATFISDLAPLLAPKNSYRFLIDTTGGTGQVMLIRSITITAS